jgi:hypothetical protein
MFPAFLFCAADSPQEEGKPKRKLNFRRLLLNKCQEEFEKGDAAMLAVAEREAKKGQGGEEEEQVGCCCCCCLAGCVVYGFHCCLLFPLR